MQINLNAQTAMLSAATHLQSEKGIQAQQASKEGAPAEEASEGPAAQAAEAGKGMKVNILV